MAVKSNLDEVFGAVTDLGTYLQGLNQAQTAETVPDDYEDLWFGDPAGDDFGPMDATAIEDVDEYAVEKVIYQTGAGSKQGVDTSGMLTPYGPGLTTVEIDAMIDKYPSALGSDIDLFEYEPEGLRDHHWWANKLAESEEFQSLVGATTQAAEDQGAIGTLQTIWSRVSDQLVDGVDNLLDLVTGDDDDEGILQSLKDMAGGIADWWVTNSEEWAYGGDEEAMAAGGVEGHQPMTMSRIVGENMAGGAGPMAHPLDQLLAPGPGYAVTPDNIYGEVAAALASGSVTRQQIEEWVNSASFDAALRTANIDADALIQRLLGDGAVGAAPLVQTAIVPGTTATTLEEVLTDSYTPGEEEPGEEPGEREKITLIPKSGPPPTTATTPTTGGGAGDDGVEGVVERAQADLERFNPGENMQKIFYNRVWAIPGTGTARVERLLPALFQQTLSLFYLHEGAKIWGPLRDAIKLGQNNMTRKAAEDKLAEGVEQPYDAFLGGYFQNPASKRTGLQFRGRVSKISRLLNLWDVKGSKAALDPQDAIDMVWVQGLFGQETQGGFQRANRYALVDAYLTNGGVGRISQGIQSAGRRLMKFYERQGKTPAEIFGLMTRQTPEQAVVPSTVPPPEGEEDEEEGVVQKVSFTTSVPAKAPGQEWYAIETGRQDPYGPKRQWVRSSGLPKLMEAGGRILAKVTGVEGDLPDPMKLLRPEEAAMGTPKAGKFLMDPFPTYGSLGELPMAETEEELGWLGSPSIGWDIEPWEKPLKPVYSGLTGGTNI